MEKYVKYFPLAMFSLAIGKMLVFTASWEGAAATLVAALLAGAYEFKNHDKKLLAMEEKINELGVKNEVLTSVINNHAKAFEEIKTHVSGLQLSRTLKSSTPTQVQKMF